MRKVLVAVGLALAVAGCGDPLAGVARISEVELSQTDPAAQALPTEQEIAREGFFGADAQSQLPPADVPADGAGTALTDAAPAPAPAPRGGFWGLLRRVAPAPAPEPAPAPVAAVVTAPAGDAADPAAANAPDIADAPVELAALSPQPDAQPLAEPLPEKRGLFARLVQPASSAKQPREGVVTLDVEYGTLLPYGVVARTCASKRQPLGRKIETATASRYKLYDSNPRATGPRTFYITGFDDGCPRQLTAAHVLFGAPSFYELLHYGPAGQHLKVAETDKAYEKIKARVCGVRRGKPCGARMNRLEKDTFFVNAYERVDDNRRWSELLVHDSVVVAQSMK